MHIEHLKVEPFDLDGHHITSVALRALSWMEKTTVCEMSNGHEELLTNILNHALILNGGHVVVVEGMVKRFPGPVLKRIAEVLPELEDRPKPQSAPYANRKH